MLVAEARRARQALGSISYSPAEKEKKSFVFRRSLYVAKDMRSGDVFTKDNLRVIRPGLGLAPKYYDVFLGKKTNRALKKGTPVSWDVIG